MIERLALFNKAVSLGLSSINKFSFENSFVRFCLFTSTKVNFFGTEIYDMVPLLQVAVDDLIGCMVDIVLKTTRP